MKSRLNTPFAAVWLAILMLGGLAALAGLLIWQNYRSELAAGEARAQSSAQLVAAHLAWMMEASEQALQRIDSALGDAPIRNNSSDTIADIREAVGDLPPGFQYSVYDETGHLRFSSVPEAVGIEVSDREYFQRLRHGDTIVVSPQLKERLSGEQVFVVGRRISRNGQFHGAASIAIPTTAMDAFWSLLELGPHSTVSVIRTDGWLVARHPQLPEAINLSNTQLFTKYYRENSDSGVYHSSVSPADGMSRIVGYRKVESWPLVATTGLETGEVLQGFWVNLSSGLIVGLPLIGLLLLGVVWIVRLLRADGKRRLALEHALERNNILLREIHHRVKNNLQAVASLVRLQPLPEESKQDMARRIAAMVAVHEQIYGADRFDLVDVAPYTERLVKEVAAGFRKDVRVETHLDSLIVGPDQALPLGLIINEALSNAFKHAFADDSSGRLAVRLLNEGARGRLVIEDDGPGYKTDGRRGMGSRLIEGFVAQLQGTLNIDSDNGTRLEISFPVDAT